MADDTLADAARALAAAFAGRMDLRDMDSVGDAVDRVLRQRLLSGYAQELEGQPPEASLRWMLERLATLEARLLTLQAAQWQGVPPPFVEQAGHAAPARSFEEILIPAEVRVLCDEVVSCEGFYSAERSGTGAPYRWLGPSTRAAIAVPRLKGPLEVRLHLFSAMVPHALERVRLSVGGGEWGAVTVAEEGGFTVLTSLVEPGDAQWAASMQLEIDAAQTDSPARHGSADQREMAFALSWVALKTMSD
ncbi:hypothetical protein EOD42_23455 [Rhodovarius crocodyli]|uniref:Uncharacterized protein n=1 Tax=Rhodovarius crocodyli TaxID=1979269 RepID=A0A437LYX1_9PROT|nr:hypothetical protein [Rhodovarius crocodyli]RVT90592.1 hypothetical protein EOD42_23455 [Rhodovarius crocodyli]